MSIPTPQWAQEEFDQHMEVVRREHALFNYPESKDTCWPKCPMFCWPNCKYLSTFHCQRPYEVPVKEQK